jgi:hypothetical protein
VCAQDEGWVWVWVEGGKRGGREERYDGGQAREEERQTMRRRLCVRQGALTLGWGQHPCPHKGSLADALESVGHPGIVQVRNCSQRKER